MKVFVVSFVGHETFAVATMTPLHPNPSGHFRGLIELLFQQLGKEFLTEGWSVRREVPGGPPGHRADFVLERGSARYVAELRIGREARRPELPALLADAYVRAQAGAVDHDARPLAIVGAPAISDAWAVELGEHANRYFRGAAWGLIDGRGKLELHGPGLDAIRRPPRATKKSPHASAHPDVFSDLGQWMAKILLAPELPERFLSAPREHVSGPTQLASLAGVSVPSASRFLRRLEQLQFLDRSEGVRLVRRSQFLAEWRRAVRFVGFERPCRWLLPSQDSLAQLAGTLQDRARSSGPEGGRACLGLFAACAGLNLGFVRGAPVHLYLEQASDTALERLGLSAAMAGERVDVFVREPMYPESLFRAAVMGNGAPVADVIQCWLDVADHPVRGAEQAERLWERVLQPHLVEGKLR
ncbi:MAG TPA: hypothetical protein VIG99_22160 [Myxococcaceae bacterium]